MSRHAARGRDTAERARLIAWLHNIRGRATLADLAAAATAAGKPISPGTLSRALNGHWPTLRTVLAIARGADADEVLAKDLWRAARAAAHRPPGPASAPYLPGWITTWAGLIRALRRLRSQAGEPSYREIAASPQAAGRVSSSGAQLILTGQRRPSRQQLSALADVFHVGEAATHALLAAHSRILTGPRPPAVYPCDIADRADEKRQDEAAMPWLALCNTRPTDDRLGQFEQEGREAQAAVGRLPDLRDELLAILARTRPLQTGSAEEGQLQTS